MFRGSCLCGGVAYEIDGRVSPIQLCHARRCRKMSASAFRHIFVGQNAPWLPIADDLPQFDERPPAAERLPRR